MGYSMAEEFLLEAQPSKVIIRPVQPFEDNKPLKMLHPQR
jgi:hypothetical protein